MQIDGSEIHIKFLRQISKILGFYEGEYEE
jgi:hypothetical protein